LIGRKNVRTSQKGKGPVIARPGTNLDLPRSGWICLDWAGSSAVTGSGGGSLRSVRMRGGTVRNQLNQFFPALPEDHRIFEQKIAKATKNCCSLFRLR